MTLIVFGCCVLLNRIRVVTTTIYTLGILTALFPEPEIAALRNVPFVDCCPSPSLPVIFSPGSLAHLPPLITDLLAMPQPLSSLLISFCQDCVMLEPDQPLTWWLPFPKASM